MFNTLWPVFDFLLSIAQVVWAWGSNLILWDGIFLMIPFIVYGLIPLFCFPDISVSPKPCAHLHAWVLPVCHRIRTILVWCISCKHDKVFNSQCIFAIMIFFTSPFSEELASDWPCSLIDTVNDIGCKTPCAGIQGGVSEFSCVLFDLNHNDGVMQFSERKIYLDMRRWFAWFLDLPNKWGKKKTGRTVCIWMPF